MGILRSAVFALGWAAVLALGLGAAPGVFGAAPAPTGEKPAPGGPPAVAPAGTPAPAADPAPEQPRTYLEEIEDFIAKTKQPVPWFKWGMDLRVRDEYIANRFLNKGLRGHETNWIRVRGRWWSTLTPVKDIDLNLRLTWEGRQHTVPDFVTPDWDRGECLIDMLNLKVANAFGQPLTMTLGRQDILLGDGWLFAEGTPLDGSRTMFFDAARFTYDLKDARTTVDLIYFDQDAYGQRWLEPLYEQERFLMEQDERGIILWVANKSIQNVEIDGYYVYSDLTRIAANGDDGHVHTFGARTVLDLTDHWRFRAEGAHQFGERNGRHLQAWGANTRLSYMFKDKLNNQLRWDYEFCSGDDPDSRTNEAFMLLFGRYTRWSELMPYQAVMEGRYAELTNLHRVAMGWGSSPWKGGDVSVDYHLLFDDENTLGARRRLVTTNGDFKGQLLAVCVKHKLTKHLDAHVVMEFFFPGGSYYDDFRNDVATFLRGQLNFTW